MLRVILLASILAVSFIGSNAECANGCSGHGRCTSYDMCVCNRNWMANDCSERVCQFGLAHVDTPKGDLDMNGIVTDGTKVVAVDSSVYPYGTTEAFPFARDSNLQDIPHSAHYYMECSNKGTCDRTTGTCTCFDGYDGAACQRASCPGYPTSCSGHGVCRTIGQLAGDDYGNIYKLWDRKSTMGCKCDDGYSGPDCSDRKCKYGIDPLYLDDSATIKFATFDLAVLTTANSADFNDGTPLKGDAYFAIRFYDMHGEDWLTSPIIAGASCSDVIDALEALPNNVIPSGQTWCTLTYSKAAANNSISGWNHGHDMHYPSGSDDTGYAAERAISYPLAFWEQSVRSSFDTSISTLKLAGYIYRLKFLGNPGNIRQPEIEIYLDGLRPSLSSAGQVITKVWTDGQQGENTDMFADHCDGVTVQIGFDGQATHKNDLEPYFYLTGFNVAEKALLKTCLADSDFDVSNNVEVYNWDYGNKNYPHIIKLVKTHTTYTDGGYYVAIYYDMSVSMDNLSNNGGTFKLLNPFYSLDDTDVETIFQIPQSNYQGLNPNHKVSSDMYEVYTTKGVLALTSNASQATFGFASQEIFMSNVSYDQFSGYKEGANIYDGDISCEVGANNLYKNVFVPHCLNQSDYFTLLNFEYTSKNPQHINLYSAKKLSMKKYSQSVYNNSFADGPNRGASKLVPSSKQRTRKGSLEVGNYGGANDAHFQTHSIITDLSTNWAAVASDKPTFHVYKFFPNSASTYEYVAPCSNRGICNDDDGTCTCFPGYSHDDCSQQNSLHV